MPDSSDAEIGWNWKRESVAEQRTQDREPLDWRDRTQLIRRIVLEAADPLESQAREAGRRIGGALVAYNLDAGHDPAWLARQAWMTYYELISAGFEEVNRALKAPPQTLT
jgi:hypothetical protein